MHRARSRIRSGLLAGTALALILAASIDASAAPQNSAALRLTSPAHNSPPPKPLGDAMPVAAAMPAPGGAASAPDGANDPEIANKIREIVTAPTFERMVSRRPDRDAIVAFYQARDYQPLWIAHRAPSTSASDVLVHLQTIGADGLDSRDYPMPGLGIGNAETQAKAELKFTETLLTYARHAMTGRIHFSRVSPNIDYGLEFDADGVLKTFATSGNVSKTLEALNPPHPAYRQLKAKLAELRAQPEEFARQRIASGIVLRHSRDSRGGESMIADVRVPRLRERLGVAAEPNNNYNAALTDAVEKFQKAHGIFGSGQLNSSTVEALNGPNRAKMIDAVLATMERWRWMPRELGRSHVVLNIPDFSLRVYHKGETVWQTRTVVGKPGRDTPLLTETMKSITVNPMPAGEHDALGQIRFDFPNKFQVYQHDTPERHYFAQHKRAYSDGCMRVQDPMKYAEVLLSYAAPKGGASAGGIKRMLGGDEGQIDFANPIPVHITYQTAFVDDDGKLQIRDDVYGLDRKLLSNLTGIERRVADLALERPADPIARPTLEQDAKLRNVARGEPQQMELSPLFH